MNRPQQPSDDYAISEVYCPKCWGKLQFMPKTAFSKLFGIGKPYRCIQCKKTYMQIFNRLVEL